MTVQTLDLVLYKNASLSGPNTMGGIDLSQWDYYSFQGVYDFSGGADSIGDSGVEYSNDGVTWYSYNVNGYNNTYTTDFYESFYGITSKYARYITRNNSGSGGTISVYLHLRKL